MSNERPGPPQSVPTLTEEVTLPPRLPEPGSGDMVHRAPVVTTVPPLEAAHALPLAQPVAAAAPASASSAPLPSEDQLTARILGELQVQVDAVLEYRVRELLTPILARATDALVRESRNELSRALRDVVSKAVAQELLKQRSR